jgi:hypothetical protein
LIALGAVDCYRLDQLEGISRCFAALLASDHQSSLLSIDSVVRKMPRLITRLNFPDYMSDTEKDLNVALLTLLRDKDARLEDVQELVRSGAQLSARDAVRAFALPVIPSGRPNGVVPGMCEWTD